MQNQCVNTISYFVNNINKYEDINKYVDDTQTHE